MRTLSKPNRLNFIYTRKFCSDINLMAQNIIHKLPGDYEDQFKMSIAQLNPMYTSLDFKERTILVKCKDDLNRSGHTELAKDLEPLTGVDTVPAESHCYL